MKKILTALLFVTTIFFAACSNQQPPVEVTATKVLAVDGSMTLTHDGKISLSDELKVLSPVSGNVVATFFEDGASIEEGQPLFQIGKQQDATSLIQAKAALAESMTALAREMSELQRAEVLLKKNSVSAQEVADKRAAVQERQAELAERQARVKQLEDDATANIVFAPISGQLNIECVQLGAAVTANETVLTTIGSSNPVAIRFEISDTEKNLLTSSAALKVNLKLNDTIYPHEGKLSFVEASMVEVTFDNADGLLTLGDTAQIVLDGLNVPKTLLVPENAVQLRGEDNYVFVVDSNKEAALKKISLGGKLGRYFIVNDGLKANDSVIVDGLTNLREGTPLLIN